MDIPIRIVLTGGPGGGKTTAADLLRREVGDKIVVVPETATLLYSGGFARTKEAKGIESNQTAIFQVQRAMEEDYARKYPERLLLCDRGTIDGSVYWPRGPEDFFKRMGTTLESEYKRYAAVLFFESAAMGGLCIEGGNHTRTETNEEAHALDVKLRKIWSGHPQFHVVPHETSFFKKISYGLQKLDKILKDFEI